MFTEKPTSGRTEFDRRITHDIPHIAFYYGNQDPTKLLDDFQIAVVDPDHEFAPAHATQDAPLWLAYLSLGEVLECAPCFDAMPPEWRIGRNTAWDAWIIDQATADWPDFLVEHIALPIWQKGYRGFFLDTLDSHALLPHDEHDHARQRAGLVRAIQRLRHAFPQAAIVTNRGFELLSVLNASVDAVAFESLYHGWDQAKRRYLAVCERDRSWLLTQTRRAKAYGLAVIAIDYCPPGEIRLAQDVHARIRRHGIVPSIADGHLQRVYRPQNATGRRNFAWSNG